MPVYYRSTTTGLGGVTFTARYLWKQLPQTSIYFAVYSPLRPVHLAANVNYTTVGGIMADIVSVGAQNTDTNLQIYHNDGSGAPFLLI